jgi:hypothetical protein
MQSLNPIQALLNTPIPDKLWHYTSISGFQGIVESKRIFATDIRFLNDREEFTHARQIAEEVAETTSELGANNFPARETLRMVVKMAFETGPLHPSRLHIFVASFSAAEDQLSQWRGYSRSSSGVSLAFDLRALRPPPSLDTAVSFAPCVYNLAEKQGLMRHAMRHSIEEVEGYWNGIVEEFKHRLGTTPPPADVAEFVKDVSESAPQAQGFGDRIRSAMVRTSADLLRVTALLKNHSFYEEREWRLVLPVLATKENLLNPLQYRVGNTTLIPYIAYPFPTSPDVALPLVDTVFGPGSDPNAVPSALMFLKSHGIRVIPRESKVPYRPW